MDLSKSKLNKKEIDAQTDADGAPENAPAEGVSSPVPAESPNSEPVVSRKRSPTSRADTGREVVIVTSVDRPFLIILLILVCIGTAMIFSASYAYAKKYFDGDSYYFISRQLIWVAVSMAVLFLTSRLKYTFYERWAPVLCLGALALLALVPIIGYTVKGAKRWIGISGLSIQPSELVKIAVVIFVAWYSVKFSQYMHTFSRGMLPSLLYLAPICLLLYKQPHLSAMVIITLLVFIMLFLGGANKIQLAIIGLLGAAGLLGVMMLTSHGKSRIEVWLHPENYLKDEGWQPYQSKLAIGSGGLWGVGLGNSTQKHLYLPEPQNDYIFAILCEELGFVFAVAVILLFMLLIWRGFYIARNAPKRFAALLAMGLTIHIGLQVFLNIAVVTNSIPATGVSLPFFSYGGSSLVVQMAEMGIILNISKYSHIDRE